MPQLLVSSLGLLGLVLVSLRLIIPFIPYHLAIFAVHAVALKDVTPRWDGPLRFVEPDMPVDFLPLRAMVGERDEFEPRAEALAHHHLLFLIRLRRIQGPLDYLDRDCIRCRGATIVALGVQGGYNICG
jgi:hypothetical protein